MKTHLISYSALAATVFAILSWILIPGAAQNKPDDEKKWCIGCSVDGKTTPRTADGHPNLSGFWDNPPETSGHVSSRAADGSVLFDFAGEGYGNDGLLHTEGNCNSQQHACLEIAQQPNQPPYKPEYAAKVDAIFANAYGGSTNEDPLFQCKPFGIPRSFGTMHIFQTPEAVAILYEGAPGSTYRIIYTDGRPHPKDLDTSYMGDSIGHWEGDTLVVDVTGLNDETWLGGSLTGTQKKTAFHSDKEHVIERWSRNGDVLTYEATVEDPLMFTRPWVITPRKIQHGRPGEAIFNFHCITEDNGHIVHATENDPFVCVYCHPDEEALKAKKEQLKKKGTLN